MIWSCYLEYSHCIWNGTVTQNHIHIHLLCIYGHVKKCDTHSKHQYIFNAYHAYHLKSIMLYQPHINLAPVLTSRWVKQLSINLSLFVARQKSLTHLPLEKNGRRFADDIFECIFMTEKLCILIRISLKFVPKCLIDNIPASVQVMAWRLTRDKPLYEPMMTQFLTHICGEMC